MRIMLIALVVLVAAPQDEKRRVEDLEKKVAELEKRVAQLEALLRGLEDEKKAGACEHLIDMLTQAAKVYELDNNAYPASGNAELVKALQTSGPKKIPYFEFPKDLLSARGEVKDPWGNALVYRNNSVDYPKNLEDKSARNKTSFDIYSFGPNGKDDKGAGDDINNWE